MKIQFPRLLQITLVASLLLPLAGCTSGKKKKDGAGGSDGDYVNGTALPERTEGVSFTSSNVDRSRFAPVHFAYDSYEVSTADQGTLTQIAAYLKGGGGNIIIAGFTDERGTEEYNRGLGERRAQAVRQYLVQQGASGSQLQTVSFGAEMPADSGSGESAWAKNRRAEFGVVK